MSHGLAEQRYDLFKPSVALARFNTFKNIVSDIKQNARARLRYGYRIAGVGLLISEGIVSEVMDMVSVYPLPHTPSWLNGIINLRGNLLPVFDLKLILDIPGETKEKQRILIIDKNDKALGILIDGFPQNLDALDLLERLPPLPSIIKPFVQRAFDKNGTMWLEFDHQGFFESLIAQIAELAEFHA